MIINFFKNVRKVPKKNDKIIYANRHLKVTTEPNVKLEEILKIQKPWAKECPLFIIPK